METKKTIKIRKPEEFLKDKKSNKNQTKHKNLHSQNHNIHNNDQDDIFAPNYNE